jgi:hypothetical protein
MGPLDVTPEQLRKQAALFDRLSDIERARVINDLFCGMSKMYGFGTFSTSDQRRNVVSSEWGRSATSGLVLARLSMRSCATSS